MATRIFATAQDVENAFYEALQRGDYELMESVWADDEEIVCVHPGGPRLKGVAEVMASWKQMLDGRPLRVQVAHRATVSAVMVAVHSLHELIAMEGEPPAKHPVVATNVYLRTAAGWRMVAHHASPSPAVVQQAAPAAAEGPKTLH